MSWPEDSLHISSLAPIATGRGIISEIWRLHLGPPRGGSLIIKVPDRESGRTLLNTRMCAAEIANYQLLAEDMQPVMPRLHFGAADVENERAVLVLEDLGDRGFGDEERGCTEDEARAAVRSVARLHARYWCSPELADLDRLPKVHHDRMPQIFADGAALLFDKYGAALPARLPLYAERYGACVVAAKQAAHGEPRTLEHGDLRADNLWFGTAEQGNPSAKLIDWQTMLCGGGVCDVAYLAAMSLPTEVRRGCERQLLEEYHGCLVRQGVSGYALSDCLQDYRLGLFDGLWRVCRFGGHMTEPRMQRLSVIFAQRVVAALEDNDALEVLPR